MDLELRLWILRQDIRFENGPPRVLLSECKHTQLALRVMFRTTAAQNPTAPVLLFESKLYRACSTSHHCTEVCSTRHCSTSLRFLREAVGALRVMFRTTAAQNPTAPVLLSESKLYRACPTSQDSDGADQRLGALPLREGGGAKHSPPSHSGIS